MAQHYSNPKRASDPYALPNVETFYRKANESSWADENGNLHDNGPGWYYWFCFPGCMPDSDPMGPFETEAEALADAREGLEDEEDDNA